MQRSVISGAVAIVIAFVFDRSSAAEQYAHFPAKGSLSSAESRTLTFGGGTRTYLIQPVRTKGVHPVVFLLHGGNSDKASAWTRTSLPTLGAKYGFIVVAPNAQMNRHWNDGRGTTGEGKPSTADDVGYLKHLIDEVIKRDDGDAGAVFMVGISNGGFMTIHFACESGQLLRAAANVIANIPVKQMRSCKSSKPLPWLSINGDRDRRVSFAGYAQGTLVLGHPQPAIESADATFAFFADKAGCSTTVHVEVVPDIDPADGSTAEKRVRSGCVGGTTSTQYVLHNAGHTVPGLVVGPQTAREMGGVNEDVDAGSVIWAHFKQTLQPSQ